MDSTWDVEMDLDDAGVAPIPAAYTQDIVTGDEIVTGEEQEPGEVDDVPNAGSEEPEKNTIVPYKVHIRGLDTFKPVDVKAYVAEHFSGDRFDRVEWVDDTSANLLFKSEATAQAALIALAGVEIADTTQLPPLEAIPAKPYAAKPDSALQVRFAVAGDKKSQGAAQRSRFYLLNPEYDPEEKRRRGGFDNRRYRDRDGDYGRDRPRPRRKQYDYDDEDKEFDVSLYDDDTDTLAKRSTRKRDPRRSRYDSPASTVSSESDRIRSQRQHNCNKELFPDRRPRDKRSRDRSASPMRNRADEAMDLDETSRTTAAMRSREKARAIKERLSKDSRSKELFPNKAGGSGGVKELFPSKVVASSEGKAQMDQVDDNTILSSAKLADRITSRNTGSAFNIRGLASKRGPDQGIAIKGAANVKELFPNKFNNTGKELFADRLEGRVKRRQRAEDSFY